MTLAFALSPGKSKLDRNEARSATARRPPIRFQIPDVSFRLITDEERTDWQTRFAGVHCEQRPAGITFQKRDLSTERCHDHARFSRSSLRALTPKPSSYPRRYLMHTRLTRALRRAIVTCVLLGGPAGAMAATCGNDASGFERWKQEFAQEAAAAGVGQAGLQALANTTYATRTISADRNQRSFRYSLEEFMRIRGADTIVRQGRQRIAANPEFYTSLERAYGVPAAVLVAIHGMETGFGNFMGDANVVSAIATLAYDCRRSDFFYEHALAALILVDRGAISPTAIGAMHGELGHTQFLPANVLRYGVDGNGDGRVDLNNLTDAMASTANFLRQKGWQPSQGYQEGQPNFAAIQAWNAATVYQRAIAIMASRIEGPS